MMMEVCFQHCYSVGFDDWVIVYVVTAHMVIIYKFMFFGKYFQCNLKKIIFWG